MKILVTDKIAETGLDILKQVGQVDVQTGLKPEQLCSVIKDYEALVVRSQTKVTADVIKAGGRLQVIGRAGVGIDNIDVDAATAGGILVVNSPEGNIISTAEHTLAMLMSMARQIPLANETLHHGVWNRSLKGAEIRNKVLGIVGLGRVGSEVAQLAKGLRLDLIGFDPMVSETRAGKLGVKLVTLETLLKESDFITVHVPLTTATRGLIGREQLKTMKPSAMVVNCARGGIIDEEALSEALDAGTIAGAAVDVFTQEPASNNVLVKNEKAVVTPHLAASTTEAEISAAKDIAEQVAAVLKGQAPKSPINAPAIPPELQAIIGPYLDLGKTIGCIAAQLAEGQLQAVNILYSGAIASEETRPVKVSIMSGLLEIMTDERVNLVNADYIAETRGLKVTEKKETTCENYTNMVTVELATSTGSTLVGASVLRGRTYLTRINDFWMEIEPSTNYMLFTEHLDRPGVIGSVGTIMGNENVNIAQMHVSIGVRLGNRAMMAVCINDRLSTNCFQKLKAIPDMYRLVSVDLKKS